MTKKTRTIQQFFLAVFAFALLSFTLLGTAQVHAQGQRLDQVFNFFGVQCLVPDGVRNVARGQAYTDTPRPGATPPVIENGVNTFPFSVRECRNGGPSLLDQAINFLYTLGPILAVIVVIWGGYLYYNSVFDGDDARAIKTVRAGVIGLAIILSVPIIYTIFSNLANPGNSAQSLFTRLTQTLVEDLIRPIANAGIVLGAAAAVISFIFAGYQYLLGDAKKGQEGLRNAFIGLIVVLASVAIVALIQVLTNFVF